MLNSTLLLATTSYIPHTVSWNPLVGIVMILCNVGAIALGKSVMQNPKVGAPLPMPEMFGGMGWTGLLATTSLGHIFGIGAILGLANWGIL